MINSYVDEYVDLAERVAQYSPCHRAQVGAVIMNASGVIVASGWNHTVQNAIPLSPCEEWCKREGQNVGPTDGYGFDCPIVHAEMWCMLYASEADMFGGTIIVTHAPCADCAKAISASGLSEVIMLRAPEPHRPDPTSYLESCGISVEQWIA